MFKNAKSLLNATRGNKAEAYNLLTAAATLGHKEARSMLAWAQLLGTQINSSPGRTSTQDIPAALQTFKELSETGLPSAHMVWIFNIKLKALVKHFHLKWVEYC